jgi:hypothetical protein
MANHKKNDLLQAIEDAIRVGGGVISDLDKETHPFVFNLHANNHSFNIKLYIWNVTHGGGSKRPQDEYRIQITGVSKFTQDNSDQLVLILGWYQELEAFIAFDFSKHSEDLGKSPSMQIKEETINRALVHGFANVDKGNGEIAVAFKPEFFVKYLENISNWHDNLIRYEDSADFYFDVNRIASLSPGVIIEDKTEDETVNYRYSVTSYGADYPVDSIVKRIKDEVIFVPPFQRKFVWNLQQASRFIESLLLGLPVPGIFLSKEESTGRLLIIDGQQRLTSIYNFYNGFFRGKKFRLMGVQEDLDGKTYQDLEPVDRNRLDDSIIHATVIKQTQPDDGDSSIYLVFERLNTGGSKLTAQEIRACIYYGEFNELLDRLAENVDWRNIFGRPNTRLKEQELVLRFFALFFVSEKYEKPLKVFLNTFMERNRNLKVYSERVLSKVFDSTISFINKNLSEKAFRIGAGINAAVFDSVMVGTAKRLQNGNIADVDGYIKAYNELINNKEFLQLIRAGTSNDINVKSRIAMAIKAFNDLK